MKLQSCMQLVASDGQPQPQATTAGAFGFPSGTRSFQDSGLGWLPLMRQHVCSAKTLRSVSV